MTHVDAPSQPNPTLSSTPHGRRVWWVSIALLAIGAAAVAMIGNGPQRGLDRSETYVARVPTEMHRRGEWLIPYYNDEIRLQKPPMNYWLAMAAHTVFGDGSSDILTEWEARLPSALAGVLLALVTVAIGLAVFDDRRVAIAAGAMFATSVGFVTESHHARPEMVYALFCGVMVLGFVQAHRNRADRWRALRWGALAWLGFAAATMTKGPHMPALIAIGMALGMVVRGRWRELVRVMRPLTGLAIVLSIGGAWFWLVYRAEPEAMRFWWHEMFDRTGEASHWWRNALKFYYVINTFKVTAPWFMFMLGALLYPWQRRDAVGERAMLLWMASFVTLLALSFSAFMRAQYITPVLPLLCGLLAADAVSLYDRLRASGRRGVLAGVHAAQTIIVAGAGCAVAVYVAMKGSRFPAFEGSTQVAAALGGGAALVAAAGFALRGRRPLAAFAALPAAMALTMVAVDVSGIGWSASRATRVELAKDVAHRVDPAREIVAVGGADGAVVVYYADRAIPLAPTLDALREALARNPARLVMAERAALSRLGISGRIVAEERELDDNGPLVVLDDVRLAAPSAAAATASGDTGPGT